MVNVFVVIVEGVKFIVVNDVIIFDFDVMMVDLESIEFNFDSVSVAAVVYVV